jgi:phospholipid transport system transporter-binding protein
MIALPAKLEIADAGAVVAALAAQATQGNGALAVDASALDQFDSAAIAVLLELKRVAKGRAFSVSGAPTAMVELAGLYGVADMLSFDTHSARA